MIVWKIFGRGLSDVEIVGMVLLIMVVMIFLTIHHREIGVMKSEMKHGFEKVKGSFDKVKGDMDRMESKMDSLLNKGRSK